MEISARFIDGNLEMLINGKLNEYDEYIEFKNTIKQEMGKCSTITLYFINTNSIDSYILGYMLKLKEINKIEINIVVGSAKLYNFLKNIDFDAFFDIKIKEYE